MKHILCVVAGLVVAVPSYAATTVIPSGAVRIENAAGGVRVFDGAPGGGGPTFIGRNSGPVGGAVSVAERYGMVVGGAAIEVVASRLIPAVGVAMAAAGAVSLAMDIYRDIYGQPGASPPEGILPDGAGGFQRDPGAAPEVKTGYSCNLNTQVIGSTPAGACGAYIERIVKPQRRDIDNAWVAQGNGDRSASFSAMLQGCNVSTSAGGYTSGECQVQLVSTRCTTGGGCQVSDATTAYPVGSLTPTGFCPPIIDPLDPAYSVPSEHVPTRPDGKCATGRYNGVPGDVGVDYIQRRGNSNPDLGPRIVDDILEKGGTIPGASERDMSGPGSATGEPVVRETVRPDGSVQRETKTPTTTYTYNSNQINYNITNTTVTTITNGGDVTTTTTTEGVSKDDTDHCKANPDSLSCMKAGEPSDPELEKDTKNVTFERVGAWGASNASCPQIPDAQFMGQSIEIDNTIICQFFSGVRFAVLGASYIAAALIVVGAVTGRGLLS